MYNCIHCGSRDSLSYDLLHGVLVCMVCKVSVDFVDEDQVDDYLINNDQRILASSYTISREPVEEASLRLDILEKLRSAEANTLSQRASEDDGSRRRQSKGRSTRQQTH